jgi:hypothetical protein
MSRRTVRAVLLYHRRQHIINVFTWPSAATGGGPKLDRNGYDALHWNTSELA